ncbi:hypothetical protein LCGC14_0704340 [marine sediment metagenome]|uniref:Uncharacterized protein n=1 Tax=marine sediment metagenome TaxID=412755 RepID=A0A0F9QLM0_9ZZZZ|nr:MAG: hypothetical protein Lokiarch_41460 [Candidatus Lokiarchaeum sp. GC14_75]
MTDEDKIRENYVEPDITIDYIFIEKAGTQIKPINDDQGYQMGFFSLFVSGKIENDNLMDFKKLMLDELNYSVKIYDHFKSNKVNLGDYKFALVDNNKNVSEFAELDKKLFLALIASQRNLMIVGKNFSIKDFKRHHLFIQWFDEHTNRS